MSNRLHKLQLFKPILILLSVFPIFSNFGCAHASTTNTIIAQTPTKPAPQEVLQTGEVRALPGKLDTVPVFNSNSPEWIKKEGILLSTFPNTGKTTPAAHLNYSFQGRFDLFAHHYTHTPKDLQTLYIGVILHNPSSKPVTVNVLQAASYLMTEAPFVTLPPYIENNEGKTYSGPGAFFSCGRTTRS